MSLLHWINDGLMPIFFFVVDMATDIATYTNIIYMKTYLMQLMNISFSTIPRDYKKD